EYFAHATFADGGLVLVFAYRPPFGIGARWPLNGRHHRAAFAESGEQTALGETDGGLRERARCRCRSSRRCHSSCASIAAREARLQIFLRSSRWWRIVLTRVGSILLNRKASGKVLRRVLIIFSLSQRKLSGRVEPDEGGLIS